MENKKSFLLYTDLIFTIEKLPDEIAGKLFKIILEYVNGINPIVDDLLMQISFEPIKQQLKRDLIKWKTFIEKQSENGKLGGRPKMETQITQPFLKKPNETQITQPFLKKPKKAVNVNVNDSDSFNVNEKEKFVEGEKPSTPIKNILKEEEKIHPLQKYILENFVFITKLKNQLTFSEAEKLIEKFPKDMINDVLLAMENFKDLSKKYQSVFLTANNWCKKRKNENPDSPKKLEFSIQKN